MSFNSLNRSIHYWAGAIVAIPLLIIVGSGLLLQAKKHWGWVQPVEQRGTGTVPVIGLSDVLVSLQRMTTLGVRGWEDVHRLDVRPGRGVAKAVLRNGYEVQIDLGTGRVLQTAYRRSDVIESIHDGSFFGGDVAKLGVFLPTGVTLLLLWCGGLWMWWLPFAARRRRRSAVSALKKIA